jgi:hypothetical protein
MNIRTSLFVIVCQLVSYLRELDLFRILSMNTGVSNYNYDDVPRRNTTIIIS